MGRHRHQACPAVATDGDAVKRFLMVLAIVVVGAFVFGVTVANTLADLLGRRNDGA